MAMATFGRGSNYTGNGSGRPSASTGSRLELKENLCPCMEQGCQNESNDWLFVSFVKLEGSLSYEHRY